ncbi:MAG TPA: hydrogenase maturation nickel metallochaperone HypA [Terriglobales bacterium]|nr:hydrogenase maturation nickel metallochaperone HypA [Terriglobales bacterium]
MSIANSILEAVRKESAARGGARVSKVGVRVGELAAIDPEALRFCFEAMVQGSDLEPLALEIEVKPRKQRCPACGLTFVVKDYNLACPTCGAQQTECVSGDELDLAYLEISS